MFCRNCGAPAEAGDQFCTRCGASLQAEATAAVPPVPPAAEADPQRPPAWGEGAGMPSGTATTPPLTGAVPLPGQERKQRVLAGILAFLLGWLGVHRFYLGYHTIAAVQLTLGIAGIFTCGVTTVAAWIWAIIDGVQILTGAIRTDAQGIPLRD